LNNLVSVGIKSDLAKALIASNRGSIVKISNAGKTRFLAYLGNLSKLKTNVI